jgi:hypothetical protein
MPWIQTLPGLVFSFSMAGSSMADLRVTVTLGLAFFAGGYKGLTNGIDVDRVVGSFDERNDFFNIGAAANV